MQRHMLKWKLFALRNSPVRASVLSLLLFLLGCATSSHLAMINSKSQCERTDIFIPVWEGEPIPKGYSDVIITANLKTHLKGDLLFESNNYPHGEPEYPFLLNVDGQAVTWKAEGRVEKTPRYDKLGRITSEGGEGMRYKLSKRIRLAPGIHKVFFALPAENYGKELAIRLEEGNTHTLEFKPIYYIDVTSRKSPSRIPRQNFMSEFREYKALLDGHSVR